MNSFRPFGILISTSALIASMLVYSCSGEQADTKVPQTETIPTETTPTPQSSAPASQFPQINSDNIEVKTFEVKDSTGKSKGWGYDLYVDNKKMIHQPIIPAIPGNNAFRTEKDAQKTGMLAAEKMRKSGSLPTLSVKELDSLGVTKK